MRTSDRGLHRLERLREPVQGAEPIEAAHRRRHVVVDIVQEPPELADPVGTLVHERLSVRRKQTDLPFGTGEGGLGQVGAGQGGSCDRGGIDRVGLAAHPVSSS